MKAYTYLKNIYEQIEEHGSITISKTDFYYEAIKQLFENNIMEKLQITKGEWGVRNAIPQNHDTIEIKSSRILAVGINIDYDDGYTAIAICGVEEIEEVQANAKLIADAGTTYNQCGLLPSELLEKFEELKKALEEIADPIKFMKERLQEGERLNGMAAVQLSETPSYLKGIANKALTALNS